MPVYGLVITLDSNTQIAHGFIGDLSRDRRVTLGERSRARLAIATETESEEEQRDLHRMLLDHPAVVHIDTTFAEVNDPDEGDPSSLR